MLQSYIVERLWLRHDLPPYLIRTLVCSEPGRRLMAASRSDELRSCLRCAFLVLGIGLKHEISHPLLGVGVNDRPQQREATTVTIDDILARREGDVATATSASLPDGEADQLQSFESAVGKVQLGIREFAARVAFVVRSDLDDHDVTS